MRLSSAGNRFLCFVFTVLLTSGVASVHAQSPIHGAWEVTARSGVDADGEWTDSAIQPSLYLFMDTHYSITFVSGDEPRPLLGEDTNRDTITEEELRSVFNPFISNAGIYEISGDQITMDPTVALWPNFMESGVATYNYELSGDTLTLSASNDEGLSIQITLTRVE